MNFEIAESTCEITNEFEGLSGWVCVSSGDLFLNEAPFGYYVAAWHPNLSHDLKMIVSTVNENMECVLTIGIICAVGNTQNIRAVDPAVLPWDDDGVLHTGQVAPEEFDNYSNAIKAFEAAKFIVNNETNINSYVSKNA